MNRHAQPWTRADDALLRELVGDGSTYRECAAELGRTWRSVQWRATALGINVGRTGAPPRLMKRARVLAVLEKQRLTIPQLAGVFGVGRIAMQEFVQRMARDGLLVRVTIGPRKVHVRYVPNPG